ncbi:hypothetical protein D3C71_1275560 [compost metagenome]
MNDFKIVVRTAENSVAVIEMYLPNGEVIKEANGITDFNNLNPFIGQNFILVNNDIEEENVLLFVGNNAEGLSTIGYDSVEKFNKDVEVFDDVPTDSFFE